MLTTLHHLKSEDSRPDIPAQPSGVIVVDKPSGLSSAAVVNRIKRLMGVKKVGHAGTLDPFATGVLICPINKATRLSRFFLHGGKQYSAVLRLGIETDTQDRTGETIARHSVEEITEERIRETIRRFVGEIEQVPPVYSALKHKGLPLYTYARAGKPVEKPPRSVRIDSIGIREINLPDVVRFDVTCSGGTYIRTLCADIGKALGCGGHLAELVRTESCGFSIAEAVSLRDLEAIGSPAELDRFVIPMADALPDVPAHEASAALAAKIGHGRPIEDADLGGSRLSEKGYLKIVDSANNLLAVVEKSERNFNYSYCCVFNSA